MDSFSIGQKRFYHADHGITYAALMRYFTRKPISCKEICRKFRKRALKVLSRDQFLDVLVIMIGRINPQRLYINEQLYLSLKPGRTRNFDESKQFS